MSRANDRESTVNVDAPTLYLDAAQRPQDRCNTALDRVVELCNDLMAISSRQGPDEDSGGPLRYREQADKTIIRPGDRVRFTLFLQTGEHARPSEAYRVRLRKEFAAGLTFDRLVSACALGRPLFPTHRCLNRTFDLTFNRVCADVPVVITYLARVDFNTVPDRLSTGNIDVTWVRLNPEATPRPVLRSKQKTPNPNLVSP